MTAAIFDSVKIQHENFTEILLESDLEGLTASGSRLLMDDKGMSFFNPDFWSWIYKFYQVKVKQLAMDMVQQPRIQKMIRDKVKVDAVVITFPWGAIFGEIFDCPIIIFSPSAPLPFMLDGTTGSVNPSIKPIMWAPFIEPMTFYQRAINHVLTAFANGFFHWIALSTFQHQEEYLRAELGVSLPSPDTILRQRSALVLSCSHPVTHGAWPSLPNVVEVSQYTNIFLVRKQTSF